jgi:nucleoside-diphosphate-sugar epimerase
VKRVLVTGCCGFIGGHLMKSLVVDNYESLGVDIRPPRTGAMLGWSFAECDILDAEKLRSTVKDFAPEVVVHLAARIDIDGENVAAYSANVEGTRNLVAAVAAAGTVRRVLFASSQLVCRVGYVPRNDTDYCPVNPYGESKVLSEKIVREHMPETITWCLLRPTTIWGEGMSSHYQRFLGHLQAGRYFHLGKGPLFKSYGYVGNTVYQILKFMNADGRQIHAKTFYLSDYEPLSLTEWVNRLAQALETAPPRSVPVVVARFLGLGGDIVNWMGLKTFPLNSYRVRNILTEYIFDMAETERICGALPFTVDQGVSRTVRWFKELRADEAQEKERETVSKFK